MARPALLGNRVTLEPVDWSKVKTLAKEAPVLCGRISDLKRRCKAGEKKTQRLKEQQSPSAMLQLMEATQDYQRAMRYAPERVKAVTNGVLAEVQDMRMERNLEQRKYKPVR